MTETNRMFEKLETLVNGVAAIREVLAVIKADSHRAPCKESVLANENIANRLSNIEMDLRNNITRNNFKAVLQEHYRSNLGSAVIRWIGFATALFITGISGALIQKWLG